MMLRLRLVSRVVFCLGLVLGSGNLATAATPTITKLSLRGLQRGETTRLAIDGTNLLPAPRLIMSVPIAKQELVGESKPNHIEFEVTLDDAVPPGIWQLWLATAQGISTPEAVAVDGLPESVLGKQVEELPRAVTGAAPASAVVQTKFQGKKGQEFVAEVEAQRLGSALKPVLHLYDARGVQLDWAQGLRRLGGDARLVHTLPADGEYTIEVHDILYRGGKPSHFRLKLGDFPYADLTFPLGVKVDDAEKVEFLSTNFPAPTHVQIKADEPGKQAVPWPKGEGPVGQPPRVLVSTLDEVMEQASSGDDPQVVTAPAAINGRLAKPGEVDRYQIEVKPGQKLHVEVISDAMGAPLDGVLVVKTPDGKEFASDDDHDTTTDPMVDLVVPDKTTQLSLELKDLAGRGGPEFVYRIEISEPVETNFELSIVGGEPIVPVRGTGLLRVRAERHRYDGPIELELVGLPKTVHASGLEIPRGATDTLINLQADSDEPLALVTSIVGRASDLDPPLVRRAMMPERLIAKDRPWIRREMALAVVEPLPLKVDWKPASEDSLTLGSPLPIEVEVERAKEVEGVVRLSLVASQLPPQRRVQGKYKRNEVREPDRFVDDLDRTLRLVEPKQLAEDQSHAQAEVFVPGDLLAEQYDLAIRAELLSEDGKNVLASADSPARRLEIKHPFTIELTGKSEIKAVAGTGKTGKITGRIERQPGFDAPLYVELTGLPPELTIPQAKIPSGAEEFSLDVSFPQNAPLGPLKRVQAVALTDPTAAGGIRSNAVPVAIEIVEGKPLPDLYRVFDEEPTIVRYLSEGEGVAGIDTEDVFSGDVSLKVGRPLRGRARLPGLGVKITEKPGPGEFRYIRFAWKTNDIAENFCLQFGTNGGVFSRAGDGRVAYAYEIGKTGNAVRAPAIRLGDKNPEQWQVVTRDLFADFGDFTFDGFNCHVSRDEGSTCWLDAVYLARSEDDFKALDEKFAAESAAKSKSQAAEKKSAVKKPAEKKADADKPADDDPPSAESSEAAKPQAAKKPSKKPADEPAAKPAKKPADKPRVSDDE